MEINRKWTMQPCCFLCWHFTEGETEDDYTGETVKFWYCDHETDENGDPTNEMYYEDNPAAPFFLVCKGFNEGIKPGQLAILLEAGNQPS